MGSQEKSKKKLQLWKKAVIHFSLCFIMGFFTGFAPTTTSLFSGQSITVNPQSNNIYNSSGIVNRSLMAEIPANLSTLTPSAIQTETDNKVDEDELSLDTVHEPLSSLLLANESQRQQQLVIITTTRAGDKFQGPFLLRLANTLRLVVAPVLWIVVQARDEAVGTADMLRSTGIMYRHLTVKENFTDALAEAEHQRNVALNHVEYHRLQGVVHFAEAYNVYDLEFFNEIRQIEVIGAWPVAMVSSNRKRLLVNGPICNSSEVVGWFSKDLNNDSTNVANLKNADVSLKPAKINVSGFAFNSSILWDPNRWGRPTALPDTSQDSFKFVQEVLGDETKVKGIPANCNKIMLWNLYIQGPCL